MWNYNIVLETEHFLSFLPNLNEKGHVLFYYTFFIILPKVYLDYVFLFLIYSKDVFEKSPCIG